MLSDRSLRVKMGTFRDVSVFGDTPGPAFDRTETSHSSPRGLFPFPLALVADGFPVGFALCHVDLQPLGSKHKRIKMG